MAPAISHPLARAARGSARLRVTGPQPVPGARSLLAAVHSTSVHEYGSLVCIRERLRWLAVTPGAPAASFSPAPRASAQVPTTATRPEFLVAYHRRHVAGGAATCHAAQRSHAHAGITLSHRRSLLRGANVVVVRWNRFRDVEFASPSFDDFLRSKFMVARGRWGVEMRLAAVVLGAVLLVGLCRSLSGGSASLTSRWPRSALGSARANACSRLTLGAHGRASHRDAPRAVSPAPSPARACQLSTWLASPHGCLVRAGAGLRLRGGAPASVPAPLRRQHESARALTPSERAGALSCSSRWGWPKICAFRAGCRGC